MAETFEKLFEQGPKLITAASKSPLAFVAYVFLLLAIIALAFFQDSQERVQVLVYVFTFLGFALFLVPHLGLELGKPVLCHDHRLRFCRPRFVSEHDETLPVRVKIEPNVVVVSRQIFRP